MAFLPLPRDSRGGLCVCRLSTFRACNSTLLLGPWRPRPTLPALTPSTDLEPEHDDRPRRCPLALLALDHVACQHRARVVRGRRGHAASVPAWRAGRVAGARLPGDARK